MDVVLIGREEPGDENLSLRYLAAALLRAGHRPHLSTLCGPESLWTAVRNTERTRPGLVGLSIPDADVALDALAFVRLLRRRGYSGHVTCGGPLATLVRHDLLRRQAGIDTVVRHAGELPLVQLADRLAAGRPWDDVAGITTRAGDGRPAPVAEPGPPGLRPWRPVKLPRILGVPVARLLASRGCPGRCAYCGPAALQEEAMREGLAGGLDREALARQGVGGIRRRPPDDVAEEVAELHHGKGARFLVLLDDNLLAGDPDAAVAWVRALRRAMERRGVGRTAWSLQLEASAVTDELVDELEALGAVRVLVGVDALTEQGLRRLGRPADPGIASRAIARLRRTGAVVSLNSILVHPGTDSPTIRAEVEALAALRGVHFDALPLVVYAGTRVWRDLRRSGELSGGAYSWRHELADSGVGRYRSALVRMRTHGMGPYGPNILAHDVAVNVALASRLGIDPRPAERAATVRALLDGLNARRIAFLFEAWELSVAPLAPAQHGTRMHELVGRFAHEMRGFGARFERLQSCLERETGAAGEPRNLFFRSAIAASLLLCGSAAAGCFQSHGATGPPDGAGDPGSDLHDGLADDGDGEARPDADDDAARPDADEAEGRPDTDAYDHAARPDVLDGDVPAAECGSPEERYLQEERARQLSIDAGCPCFISHGPRYGLVVDSTGHVVDVCPIDDSVVTDEVRACYLEALAGETFPCLAGEECWAVCMEILM